MQDIATPSSKRNILGVGLPFMAGLPTDWDEGKQIKLDEEMRDRVTATLTRKWLVKSLLMMYLEHHPGGGGP
jgi:hypothetical protein